MSRREPFEVRTGVSTTCRAAPEVVFDVIADLRNHLVWSGERASDPTFKLLTMEAPAGPATVGTTFATTGANYNGTFRDRSTVTEVRRPVSFVIETDAHLERRRGRPWEAHFRHRYELQPSGDWCTIVYEETISRVSYVPYWLSWWARPLFRPIVNRADTKQLRNLARLAEERMRGAAPRSDT